ncbi:cytosolic phospholipase A2 epsilon-like [Lagopus leucura]|uniref:cytosolic phospholipase A2 epsilon-like n=1 Tax=Lagopus leucura TaxID=30410 RepID=UPI001C66D2BF|nr:cytosolic phospholipase A2 epsilon-like [Lagopus leucura]
MSQELLPVEVPESLSYVYPGKTMMPLGTKGLEGEEDADFLRHYNPYDYSGGAGPQEEGERSIEPGKGDFKIESSPCYLLTVRIIRMRNLQRVDALSQADCYVSLWLPTAAIEKCRTKTIRNSNDPVWNETFYFRIQSKVKNVLELTVYDEDFATPDDHLLCTLFDTAKLPVDRTVLLYFKPSSTAKEELEVEFKLETLSGPYENIATNGVLVCRELCCLEVEVNEKQQKKSKKELSLTVKGSFEGTQDITLGPDGVVSPSCPTKFHYIKYAEPTLDVMLPKKRRYHPWTCRFSTETGSPVLMLNSLPMGMKTTIAEEKRFDLNVKAERCNCSCRQDLDMRFGFDLCSDERAFLGKRKKYVASAMKNVFHLQEDLQDHEVPVVAIITTGGGLKSMTGLYGSLMGLKKLNLLDCVTYISGLSGTTWTMANLYRDAYWSQKDLDSHISEAQKQATKCKMGCFSMDRMKYYNKQLCQRKEEGYRTSFIDLWGLMIEYLLNDGKDPHKLSDQREALCDGQNPLPIYVSVCVRDNYSTQDFKEWVEFTPYEVGLLKYGAFIPAENFGSKFFMGRMLKKLPESRICYLQGMWSSIFSVNLLQIWGLSHSSEDFWKRWTQDKIDEVDEDPVLPTRPHELRTRMYTPPGTLSSALRGALTDRFSVAQHHNFLRGYQLHNDYFENEHFCQWKDTVLDSRPNELMQNPDHLGMIDAGFFINTSSPPLLRRQREVDVIIYLSYTTGSHTLTLDKACKYYSEQKIPFPKISLSDEDKKNLKECYIFQDSDSPRCPIVIFLPLVNDTFQEYKAPGVKRCCSEMEEGKLDLTSRCSPYCMFSVRYTDENYRRLLNLSEYNILNNSQMIMQALQTAMQRRRQNTCC